MKAIGKMINVMEKEKLYTKMEIYMKEIGKKIEYRVKERWNI